MDAVKAVAVIFALGALCAPAARASFEKGGLLDEGPRAAALAGATVALADDVITARACPAGLVQLHAPAFAGAWGMDGGSELTSFVLGAAGSVEGAGLSGSVRGIGDGSLNERTVALGAGFPVAELHGISFGTAFKVLSANLDVDQASGFGFDAGVMGRHPVPWNGLEICWAACIEDALGGLSWKSGFKEDLPRQGRLGLGGRLPGATAVLMEVRLLSSGNGRDSLVGVGGEQGITVYGVPVAFRAGWRNGSGRSAEVTGGLGAQVGPVSVDYAAVQETAAGGGTEHLLAASWAFFSGSMDSLADRGGGSAAESPVAVQPKKATVELDSRYQAVDFAVRCPSGERTTGWLVIITGRNGEVVWDVEGEGRPPTLLKWNGTTTQGELAPAGEYSCVLMMRGGMAWRKVSHEARFVLKRRGEAMDLAFPETSGGF